MKQKGQALVETLITYIILFAVFFVVLEITRLIAFKNCLQAVVNDIAAQISYAQLSLKRDHFIPVNSENEYVEDKKFKEDISKKIAQSLEKFSTSLLSFDFRKDAPENSVLIMQKRNPYVYIRLVSRKYSHSKEKIPDGVYIKVNTCLPVLFSSYFRFLNKEQKNTESIGMKIDKNSSHESNRDCLGEIPAQKSGMPLFWFRIRAAAYKPWPASTQIFEKGFAPPQEIYGLEQENRKDVAKMLMETNLSSYLKESK